MSLCCLEVLAAGPMVSIQDLGRHGFMRYGITPAGVMDADYYHLAIGLANLAPTSMVIEIPLGGLRFKLSQTMSCTVISRGFSVMRNAEALGACARFDCKPGDRVHIKAGHSGNFAYLALTADFAGASILGSMSTHNRSSIGPAPGRALQKGDQLWFSPHRPPPESLNIPAPPTTTDPIRCIEGPQADYFNAQNLQRFCAQPWTLGAASDRMAITLEGQALQHRSGFDVLSEGVNFGSIQVPGNGQPLVLMADRQPTGGYPKIATIISADLPRLAQMRCAEVVYFSWSNLEEASKARKQQQAQRKTWLENSLRADLSSEHLLRLNLIDGVVDAKNHPEHD